MWDLGEYFWQFVNPRKKFSHSSIFGVFRGHKTQYFSLVLRQTPAVSSRKTSIFLLKHVVLLVDFLCIALNILFIQGRKGLRLLLFKINIVFFQIFQIISNIIYQFPRFSKIQGIKHKCCSGDILISNKAIIFGSGGDKIVSPPLPNMCHI